LPRKSPLGPKREGLPARPRARSPQRPKNTCLSPPTTRGGLPPPPDTAKKMGVCLGHRPAPRARRVAAPRAGTFRRIGPSAHRSPQRLRPPNDHTRPQISARFFRPWGAPVSRRASAFTQADVARALRAAEQVKPGAFEVAIAPGGEICVRPSTPHVPRREGGAQGATTDDHIDQIEDIVL
jgi:hypothetical protein